MASEGPADGDAPDSSREQGIEFGRLQAALAEQEYPISGGELLAAYGEFEIGLPGGSTTLQEVLGERQGDGKDDIQYDSADDVHQSVHNMVGSDAVGREEYTDRGGSQQVSDDGDGQDSI